MCDGGLASIMGFLRIVGISDLERYGARGKHQARNEGFSRQAPPRVHVDLVSLCSKVHPFPTVIYSSSSSGDLVIPSERAQQASNTAL